MSDAHYSLSLFPSGLNSRPLSEGRVAEELVLLPKMQLLALAGEGKRRTREMARKQIWSCVCFFFLVENITQALGYGSAHT